MEPIYYCRHHIAPEGSLKHYACLFLPDNRKSCWLALQSIFGHLNDCVEQTSSADIALTKLNWWTNELHQATGGKSSHPAVQLLFDSLSESSRLDRLEQAMTLFEQIIQSFEHAANYPLFDDLTAWQQKLHQQQGSITRIFEQIFADKTDNKTSAQSALEIGAACQLGAHVLRTPALLAKGYPALPLTYLHESQTEYEALFKELLEHPQALALTEKCINHSLEKIKDALIILESKPSNLFLAEYCLLLFYQKTLLAYKDQGALMWQNANQSHPKLWPLGLLWVSFKTSLKVKSQEQLA